MKRFTKQVIGHMTAISVGALGGFSIVRAYLDSNPYFLILTIPAVIYTIYNAYMIRKSTRKIKQLRKGFKDKYGFDIYDKEATDKYLDEIKEGKK